VASVPVEKFPVDHMRADVRHIHGGFVLFAVDVVTALTLEASVAIPVTRRAVRTEPLPDERAGRNGGV
jgi:hypothetical protein